MSDGAPIREEWRTPVGREGVCDGCQSPLRAPCWVPPQDSQCLASGKHTRARGQSSLKCSGKKATSFVRKHQDRSRGKKTPRDGLGFWARKVTADISSHARSPSWSKRKGRPCPRSPPSHKRLPSERVDLQSEFLQEAGLGGIGQDEDHVHVAWPQADQVTGVGYIRELSYLHEAFFRNLAVEK